MSLASGAERLARRCWSLLPEEATDLGVVQAARKVVYTRLRGAPPPEQRVVRTLDELDEMIAMLEGAVRVSDDELRRGFKTFRMELDVTLPPDPFSSSYRRAVLELYEWLHGKPYSPANEITLFDLDRGVREPFPFLTRSSATVGEYMAGVGHLIKTLDVAAGARVLELGPGWGNVAIPLARMGCDVTAVDICSQFTELVERRAAQEGVALKTITGDFSVTESLEEVFDVVVFFESFHHSADHLSLLGALERIVSPGGKVVFAAEPVERRFWAAWGPRLDGESLWAIRRNGWLELGFRRDYFIEALRRHGWTAKRVDYPANQWGQIFVATR